MCGWLCLLFKSAQLKRNPTPYLNRERNDRLTRRQTCSFQVSDWKQPHKLMFVGRKKSFCSYRILKLNRFHKDHYKLILT